MKQAHILDSCDCCGNFGVVEQTPWRLRGVEVEFTSGEATPTQQQFIYAGPTPTYIQCKIDG